jgi:hypothetical protein
MPSVAFAAADTPLLGDRRTFYLSAKTRISQLRSQPTLYTTSLILMRHWRQLGLYDRDLPLVRALLILKIPTSSDLAAVEMEIDLTSAVGPHLSPQPNLFRP